MSRNLLTALVAEAFRDPRQNGRRIAAWPLPGATLGQALILVAVLSTLGVYGVLLLSGAPPEALSSPLLLAVTQGLVMVLLAGLMGFVGRLFGGTGDFAGALRVVIWIQAVMLLVQLGQILVVMVLPALGGLLGMLTLAALGWIVSGLVAGLHGFQSQFKTFIGIIATMLAFGFVLSLLLAPFVQLTV